MALALLALPGVPAAGPAADPAANQAERTATSFAGELGRARALLDADRNEAAASLARRLLAESDSLYGADSPHSADVLDVLVGSLWRNRETRDPRTRALAERAVALRRKLFGPDDPSLGQSLYNLALVLRVSGQYAAAESAHVVTLEHQRRTLPAGHVDIVRTLNSLGLVHARSGRRAEARARYEEALALAERLERGEKDVATVLYNYGNVLRDLGELEQAKRMHERGLAIRERVSGPDDTDKALLASGLGRTLQSLGDYDGANRLFEQALRIYEKVEGPEGAHLPLQLNNLAVIQMTHADYGAARLTVERALAIEAQHGGAESPDALRLRGNLAYLDMLTGNYEAFQRQNLELLEITKQRFGPEHPTTARRLRDCARANALLGDLDAALTTMEDAVSIFRKSGGPEDLAGILFDLSVLQNRAGRLDDARRSIEESLASHERAGGSERPPYAESLDQYGVIQARAGRFDTAAATFQRAAAIYERCLGRDHPWAAAPLAHLSRLYVRTGRPEEAFRTAIRVEEIMAGRLPALARNMPEEEALRFEGLRTSGQNDLLSVVAFQPSPERNRRAWGAVLRSRALVLDEMASRHRSVLTSGDPELQALAEEVERTRRALARLLVLGAGTSPGDSTGAELDRALEAREQAERALAVRSAGFRHEAESSAAGIDEVAAALPPASVLIAYCEYAHREGASALDRSERGFLAFLLRSGDPRVDVVRLGPASVIEEAVTQWRRTIAGFATDGATDPRALEARSREAGTALRTLLWDPLEPLVDSGARVFVVPDGAIHLVPFGALPVGGDGYLVEREGGFHVLSAERDLILRPESLRSGRGLLALGDVDFDAPPRTGTPRAPSMIAGVGSTTVPPEPAYRVPYRGISPDCGGFGERVFEPLPGSSREIEDIERIWKRSARADGSGPIAELRRDRAREDLFAREAQGKRVLHLATHGFVLSGCFGARGSDFSGDRWDEVQGGRMPDSPLRLSGLALAGANHRGSAARAEEDGILTAEEIATLDLAGVELAVLSGCETGIGDVHVGEGVLGMTRAFRIAGVRTLVYSLWPVEDRAGAAWMRAFHAARLQEDLDVPSAARRASLEVLHDLRSRGEVAHPILWGGFVASGGWR